MPRGERGRGFGHEDELTALVELPHGRLASASGDKTVRIWRLDRSKVVLESTLTVARTVRTLAYDRTSGVLVASD